MPRNSKHFNLMKGLYFIFYQQVKKHVVKDTWDCEKNQARETFSLQNQIFLQRKCIRVQYQLHFCLNVSIVTKLKLRGYRLGSIISTFLCKTGEVQPAITANKERGGCTGQCSPVVVHLVQRWEPGLWLSGLTAQPQQSNATKIDRKLEYNTAASTCLLSTCPQETCISCSFSDVHLQIHE